MKSSTSMLAWVILLPATATAFQPLVTDDTGTQGAGGNQLEAGYNRTVDKAPDTRDVAHQVPRKLDVVRKSPVGNVAHHVIRAPGSQRVEARVGDVGDVRVGAIDDDRDPDGAAVRSVLRGVADEVREELAAIPPVDADRRAVRDVELEPLFALSERGATSAAAGWLAKQENDADMIGGVNLEGKDKYLKMTLADLSLSAQINDSLKLARAVLSELGGVNTLHKQNVEQAGFDYLWVISCPTTLYYFRH